jgi:hypothetical protein
MRARTTADFGNKKAPGLPVLFLFLSPRRLFVQADHFSFSQLPYQLLLK